MSQLQIPVTLDTGEVTYKEVSGASVSIQNDAKASEYVWEPIHVDDIAVDLEGNTEKITIQCGDTEVRKNGDTNWNLEIEGIIKKKNLHLFNRIATAGSVYISADVLTESETGLYVPEGVTKRQTNDLNSIEEVFDDGSSKTHKAFPFQLQFKQPE